MTDDIKITFIIPKHCSDENDCSESMQLAFISCEQHSSGGLQAQWVHESKYNRFDGLTKKDVFVLSDFEGELYEKLRTTKCLLVGPRCLSCCLTEGRPIPSGPEPVFTVAMRGLVVTASGFTKQKKEKIKQKVFWMGGIYKVALTEDTTHLVSDNVLSDKYIKAVEKGIPVMSEAWVAKVWETSLNLNINGSASEFDVHRLPPFANLQITTSGISKKDKQMIMKLVNEHGGTFSGAFQSETTDVVILNKDGVGSEKYKAALEYGKACVLPAWVKDSAAMDVALPMARYKVAGASTSSPLAEHRLPDMSLNFSRITMSRPPSNYVNETKSDVSTLSGKMKLSQERKQSNDTSLDRDVQLAFESLDMSSIKKAGPIFDGFCMWVTGLEGVARERASACVSRAGGVRYDAANERVTHIVTGNKSAALLAARALPAVPVLSARWLARSVQAGKALDEAEFLIDTAPGTPKSARKAPIDAASPMSKRNLQLLRNVPHLPPPQPIAVPEDVVPQEDIVNHYLSQPMPVPDGRQKTPEPASDTSRNERTEITQDEPTEEIEQIFRGIKLEVQGLDEEAICELGAELAAAGGLLVAAGAGGSHVLVPLDFDTDDLINQDAEAVTVFWVKDCLSQQELLPIQYYHRPVRLPTISIPGPLHGVVATLSTYSGVERAFLDELAKLLGATTQLRFCRRNTANALASTHLICPSPVGDKFTGALKWGLPAVTADWLLECARTGTRVSERGYLVGDTKAPPSPDRITPIEEQPEPIENQQTDAHNLVTDKENAMLPPPGTNVPKRGSIPSREDTPKGKLVGEGDGEMSPASRYIAMARQGLLGTDSQPTPKRLNDLKDCAKQVQKIETPDSAFGCALRPGSGRLSPDARKRLWRVVNELPGKEDQPQPQPQTPLSEIRNRFLAQFNDSTTTHEHSVVPKKLHFPVPETHLLQDQMDTPPAKMPKLFANQNAGSTTPKSEANDSTKSASSASKTIPAAVDAQLQRLSAALSGLSGQRARRATRDSLASTGRPAALRAIAPESEPGPESQPNTVGWDDSTPPRTNATEPPVKRFMLSSNVDNREEIIDMIQYLGGTVCEGTELDLEATHLLCCAPGRSEKMLGSVAAGRWVLHPAYIARSRQAASFLDEEEYEWGNPKATCLPNLSPAERTLAEAAHRWRAARDEGRPGPFAGVRALLHIPEPRRRLLARLVTAGDGTVLDDKPPYNNDSVTVCFADIKRLPLSDRDTAWLVSRAIPVCAPVLLSAFLTDSPPPNPKDHCLPDFRPA